MSNIDLITQLFRCVDLSACQPVGLSTCRRVDLSTNQSNSVSWCLILSNIDESFFQLK